MARWYLTTEHLRLRFALLLLVCFFTGQIALADERSPFWAAAIDEAHRQMSPATQVVTLSRYFLEVPYQPGTLGGGAGRPEELTINLEAVDCFTLIDYVEAMRRSSSVEDFPAQLVKVRYQGDLSWAARKHFFTDWIDDPLIEEGTVAVGSSAVRVSVKSLNLMPDGTLLLAGTPVRQREVRYLPTDAVDGAVLARLRAGDYIGIYAEPDWLDVSHVGILVLNDGRPFLRHASSRPELSRVVDTPLLEYLRGKPGIVVLRPRGL